MPDLLLGDALDAQGAMNLVAAFWSQVRTDLAGGPPDKCGNLPESNGVVRCATGTLVSDQIYTKSCRRRENKSEGKVKVFGPTFILNVRGTDALATFRWLSTEAFEEWVAVTSDTATVEQVRAALLTAWTGPKLDAHDFVA